MGRPNKYPGSVSQGRVGGGEEVGASDCRGGWVVAGRQGTLWNDAISRLRGWLGGG